MTEIDKLRITVTKTADGQRDYVQVISSDQFTVNVVLIAGVIDIVDTRPPSIGRKKTKE